MLKIILFAFISIGMYVAYAEPEFSEPLPRPALKYVSGTHWVQEESKSYRDSYIGDITVLETDRGRMFVKGNVKILAGTSFRIFKTKSGKAIEVSDGFLYDIVNPYKTF